MRGSRGSRGFNLIEMLMVLSIGAILLAIAVPNFRDFVNNSRRAAASNEVIAIMQYARGEVLKRGGRVTVCPSANGATCTTNWSAGWLAFVNAGTDPSDCTSTDTDDRVLKYISNDNQAVNLTAVDQAGAALNCYHFRGYNMVNTKAATITVCDADSVVKATRRRAVVVDYSGRASISNSSYTGSALVCS